MENLQGGTLALEHRYHFDARRSTHGLVTIYEGTQDPFGLPVLIDVYDGLLEAGASDDVSARIKQSATRASALSDPGLLSVVDFGEIQRGVPFIIEESVPGPTLADKLDERAVFGPDEVGRLITRVATLLQPAHDDGLYHGSLQPHWIHFPDENAPVDAAVLSHFGLGPSMAELVAMPQAVLTTDLVDAFAPECFAVAARDQADAEPAPATTPHLSAAADQWALAALAYRLLVGVHPYFDDPVDASEGILRIKTEAPPSLSEMGVDADLAAVIDRALSRAPKDRWPSIEAFAQATAVALGQNDERTAPKPPPEEAPDQRPRPAATDEHDDAPGATTVGPRPSGYLLTLALTGLILSNLGWTFWLLNDDAAPVTDGAEEQADAPPSPETLPSGFQLSALPAEADLVAIDGDDETVLGQTPHVITEQLLSPTGRQFQLRRPGFYPQTLVIEETEAGQNLAIEMIASEDQAPQE